MISKEIELIALSSLAHNWPTCGGCGQPATRQGSVTWTGGSSSVHYLCDTCKVPNTRVFFFGNDAKFNEFSELAHAKLARRFTALLKNE